MAEQWLCYYGMDGQSNADYQDGLHMPTGPTPGGNAAPGWAGVYTWTFQPSSAEPTWTEGRLPQPSTSYEPPSTGPTWSHHQLHGVHDERDNTAQDKVNFVTETARFGFLEYSHELKYQ